MDPEQQLYIPKVEDIATAVIEMYGSKLIKPVEELKILGVTIKNHRVRSKLDFTPHVNEMIIKKYYEKTNTIFKSFFTDSQIPKYVKPNFYNVQFFTGHVDILTWFRYIDDIFCIVKADSLDKIHAKLNSLYPDILFTVEKERNSSLAFLDILITRQSCRYMTNVYYKPSFYPSYIHYSSYCPLSHKINTVKTLSKRIFTHCSSQEFKQIETQNVIGHLMNSGYPKNFILRHFYNPQQHLNSQIYRSTCTIPFSTHSVNISRFLKNNYGIRTFYTNTPKLETIVRNPITRNSFPVTLPLFTNSVYSLKCSNCNSIYIGETGRRIKDRMDEHYRNIRNNEPKSLIVQHIRQTGHSFNTSHPHAYYSNINSKFKRLIVEALLSLKHNSINRHIEIPDAYKAIFP
ncbi:hypothetical protein LAZ67_5001295 [Cordylochernes scorpioides]|uniref:Helix-turn-helix domain-containing protein n=1 Tax=Cordylochernes scorpioides TaxID=51811 RepID=A0ABY6KG89_9ARAC|nr:hypothetical protein LAZ67_5001295 [Cordylochernes scorpioides]